MNLKNAEQCDAREAGIARAVEMKDQADRIYQGLASPDCRLFAAWSVLHGRASKSVGGLSKDVSRSPKHPEIQRLLDDERLGIVHSQAVCEQLPDYDSSLTYWQDTFLTLGTIGEV